ncbi:MAG: Slp family lipoprotein [Proteobacteria bacterium]|nr:Slp family lipoprotein [Pseudomonadota bacterium]
MLAIGAFALLGGCATIPAPLTGNDFSTATPQQVVATNADGQRVRWGGEIIRVDPHADRTCFEILSRELYADARPSRRDKSDGRFIACKQGFFDPEVYTRGRDVTVVGSVGGTERRKVGDYDYTFAKVDATEVYMWPKRAAYPPGYTDPFWGPCWGNPFWSGPYWGGCGGLGYGGYWGGPPVVIVRPNPPPKSGK